MDLGNFVMLPDSDKTVLRRDDLITMVWFFVLLVQ